MRNLHDKLLQPDVFLSVAENYNLATRIDRWVIENTLKWFHKHPRKLAKLDLASINLSGQSLSDPTLYDFITQKLETYDFPHEKLCFEITETAAILNLSEAMVFIDRLKKLGVRFSLDDFGSGLSSFAYLKTLPIDFLKIDGQFVKGIVSDPIDYAMVKSINEIGQVMDKQIIAEYVESLDILRKSELLGINFAQGFYIGKPCPIADIYK